MTLFMYDTARSISRVLVATDFSTSSQSVVDTAIDVCRSFQATLSLLHVFEEFEKVPVESRGLLLEVQAAHGVAQQRLDNLAEQARQMGVDCSGRVVCGSAASEILVQSHAQASDLVVMGTRGIYGFGRLVFGSTAETVLRQASCPVLTIGPHTSRRGRETPIAGPVVFPTDFHAATTKALRFAVPFQEGKKHLHCVHVLPRSVDHAIHSRVVPEILKLALQHIVLEAGAAMEPAVCAIEYSNEVSNAVVKYASEVHAGLVVLGVRQASLLTSHLPAHIAYRIITEAPCPVLTVACREHSAA